MKLLSILILMVSIAQAQVPNGEEVSPLALQMQAMSSAFKTLAQQGADPAKKQENLGHAAVLRKAILNAVELTPSTIEEDTNLSEDQKIEMAIHFRQSMIELLVSVPTIELSLLKNDALKLKEELAIVDAKRKKGHADFR